MTETEEQPHLIGYARVSTDDQRLDLQLDALTRHGIAREDIHTDTASGATTKNRPGLAAMWKDLRKGDILVVWKLDRLGRDLSELIQTANKVRERGAQLRSLTESIDTSTPYGTLMFHLIGMFAQFERDLIRERTKAGQAAGRLRGKHPGRRPLTPEQVDAIKACLRAGKSPLQAADETKIGKSTIYRHLADIRAELAVEETDE